MKEEIIIKIIPNRNYDIVLYKHIYINFRYRL